jgi:hypothetical protein
MIYIWYTKKKKRSKQLEWVEQVMIREEKVKLEEKKKMAAIVVAVGVYT